MQLPHGTMPKFPLLVRYHGDAYATMQAKIANDLLYLIIDFFILMPIHKMQSSVVRRAMSVWWSIR